MNFVWSKCLNSGAGVKQRHQLVGDDGAATDAAEQTASIENEEIFNSYSRKSQEMAANTERSISTIQQLKKDNRDVQEKVKENAEAGLQATAP